ncbi:ganglioside-induced differentiation-associated protein 1 [Cephus cinctus]|uniref:Ganglioside-induced differentiation-associated protein 1 n=1 Tax=Cephus cinctus TaxID=211228 RepID=A0AAJ7CDT7_CEPCN|nr:ganglioside-induced differentiation-associated protein 1 [Cephus cinctus]XP_015608148.1 ganglioside-induced differentiation-associated protein 1 [Cephus cinctus]XP_024947014.1 ganglioside-induced differentiation-associated protein 1 [Cephus cinctus]
MAENGSIKNLSAESSPRKLLYYHRYSFYSQKVLLAINEKRLLIDLYEIDFANNEQCSAWFLQLASRGDVPVLKDGDKIIDDATPIIDHLEAGYPDAYSLLPSDPTEKHRILELRRILDQLPGNTLTVGSFRHTKFVDRPRVPFINPVRWLLLRVESESAVALRINANSIPAARAILERKAAAMEKSHDVLADENKFNDLLVRVEHTFEKIEDALKKGPWLGGDLFTVADISLAILLERLTAVGLDTRLWGNKPLIGRYYDRLQERESVQAAVPKGWINVVALIPWRKPAVISGLAGLALLITVFALRKKILN